MVRKGSVGADIPRVSIPPTFTVAPSPAPVQAAVKRRASLTRRVSAVTQLGTAAAITSTGVVVGALGHQAQVADALKAQAAQAQPKVIVVRKPVARPVRTVVVRRPAAAPVPAAQLTSTRTRAVPPPTRAAAVTRAARPAPAPAPRATQAAPATKTTGS